MSYSLQPHRLPHTRLPIPTPSPGACSNTYPLSGDAIQPSHPLLSPSPSFIFCSIRVFSNESAFCIMWPKYWSFSFSISPSNELIGLISFRIDWFGSPCSTRASQEYRLTPQLKSINSLTLSFLYSPTLTSIHDYWKNHSFD